MKRKTILLPFVSALLFCMVLFGGLSTSKSSIHLFSTASAEGEYESDPGNKGTTTSAKCYTYVYELVEGRLVEKSKTANGYYSSGCDASSSSFCLPVPCSHGSN
jgi:hypothetical protein